MPELRIEVGDVTVLVDRKHAPLGTALAEAAGRARTWLGLGRLDLGQLVLVVVSDTGAFAGWSRGKVPAWGAGLTMPGSRLVVIRADGGDPFTTLWHELAHVALHQQIVGRVPLWFDEGYAVLAAGEFGRIAGLQLNLSVASGRVPTLRELDGELRGSRGDAEAGYALAGSAVAYLARLNPTHGLEPLLGRLRVGMPFDEAVEATTGLSLDRFGEAWHRDVRRRHNWLIWLATGGAWLIVALMLGWAAAWRRHRDAPRRAALNIGWEIPPPDDDEITSSEHGSVSLDPPDSDR
ncbi:MAG: hypothetical protein ABJC19_01115 [Gemmatimonadota bacterium]